MARSESPSAGGARSALLILGTVLSVRFAFGSAAEARQPNLDSLERQRAAPAAEKGPGELKQLAAEMGDLIRLKMVGERLRLDRARWAEAAGEMDKERLRKRFETFIYERSRNREHAAKQGRDAITGPDFKLVFKRLQLAAKAEHSGGGDYGWGIRRYTFRDGGGLTATVECRDKLTRILLEERQGPRRRLTVFDSQAGALRLMLTSRTDGSLLILHQRRDGLFSAACADAHGAAGFRESSFKSFYRKHRRYAEGEILRRLRRLGIDISAMPRAPHTLAQEGRPTVPTEDPGRAARKKGPLQEVSEDVGRLIGLAADRKGLRLDRTHWRRSVKDVDRKRPRKEEGECPPGGGSPYSEGSFRNWPEERAELAMESALLMRLLYQACAGRWPEVGSAGSGIARRLRGAGGMDLAFSIDAGLQAGLKMRDDRIGIYLIENRDPWRHIEIADDGRGALRILVMGMADGSILMINQGTNGRFSLANAEGRRFFVVGETSFQAFSRRYEHYAEQRLFAYLKHLGIATPVNPYSAAVQDAVVLKLTAGPPQHAREARRLIAQLNDKTYRRRQEAMQLLTIRFARYRQALQEVRKDTSLPLETKSRLERIFRNAPDLERIEQVVSDMGLLQDVGYLIDLLGRTKGEDRTAVAAQLRKVTGDNFGEDPEAWQSWWSKQRTR